MNRRYSLLLRKINLILSSVCFLFWVIPGFALTNDELPDLLHRIQFLSLKNKILQISGLLLNTSYQFEPLGEGVCGEFNQKPLYRFDLFDCETYVDTVLALALTNKQNNFYKMIQKIRYQDDEINFTHRNHFADLQWLLNNQYKGFVEDITAKIADPKYLHSVILESDMEHWYQSLPIERIAIPNLNLKQRYEKLYQLHRKGKNLGAVQTSLSYISINDLPAVLSKIPNGTILLIVSPKKNSKNQSITNTIVKHMGFAIWKQDVLYLRAASSYWGRVIDVPLLPYLQFFKQIPDIGVVILMPKEER